MDREIIDTGAVEPGTLVWTAFGANGWGRQLAIVVRPVRTGYLVRKWLDSGRRWTEAVTVRGHEVRALLIDEDVSTPLVRRASLALDPHRVGAGVQDHG